MEQFEYEVIDVVMDGSKDADGLRKFHNTFGACGWKLINSYKMKEVCGYEVRTFAYIREKASTSFNLWAVSIIAALVSLFFLILTLWQSR